MSIASEVSNNGQIVKINVTERFEFEQHREFRKAYQEHPKPKQYYLVNLSQVRYMDSSALGMLLLLQEYSGKKKEGVRVVGATEECKQLLYACELDEYLHISDDESIDISATDH
ncbi:STAS domain-containing protein [Piscirickettsia litoralis]|uniref:STAS domain-containing protein n=1 Tax=Piscirickettsia litoralis TaxID=1891921 RepID=A0ABX2ZZT7_9GAMM|nr:STAS domain-containing protein [Piscirickettsia litoralis]ODN42116.1 hypothetical protein BGC07_03090 [Piscirickettsia litoralis]